MAHVRAFRKPAFPLYNAVFASPLAPLENSTSRRSHHPKTWQATIAPRSTSSRNSGRFGEVLSRSASRNHALFRSRRLASSAEALVERERLHTSVDKVVCASLLPFLSYRTGMAGSIRVLSIRAPAEALSATIIVSCAVYLTRDRIEGPLIALPICALLILSTKPLPYGRIPWTRASSESRGIASRNITTLSSAPRFPHSLCDTLLPAVDDLPEDQQQLGARAGNEMWRRLHQRVAAAPADRWYWLEIAPYATQEEADSLLASFDLVLQQSSCDETKTNFDSLRICRINQRPPD